MKPIITIWILLILLIISLFWIASFLRSEADECLSNPITYGINKISSDVSCNCVQRPNKYFNINNTDVWFVQADFTTKPVFLWGGGINET